MQKKIDVELGRVKIHNDAISAIAGHVVNSIPGVVSTSGNIVENITEKIWKKMPDKGIKTEIIGEEVKIDISVIVQYGTKIPEIAWQIQKNVRKTVEEMTGLHVSNVNVSVEGVELSVKKLQKNKEDINENPK